MTDPYLALINARNLMPHSLAHDTVSHMVLSLAFIKILSDNWRMQRVFQRVCDADETALVAAMRAKKRVVMHEASLFDSLRRPAQPGLTIEREWLKLVQAQPGLLDGVLFPERFALLEMYFESLRSTGKLTGILNLVGEMGIEDTTPSMACATAFANLTSALCPASHRADLRTAQLMAHLLQPQAHERILDPACGMGLTLLACAGMLGDKAAATLHLQGMEPDLLQCSLAKMLMILSGLPQTHIAPPQNAPVTPLQAPTLAEIVLMMLPDSAASWPDTRTVMAGGRWLSLPEREAETAGLVWQAMAHMKPGTGRMALLLPQSVFNERARHELARYLVTRHWLDAVITLPPAGWGGKVQSAQLLLLRQQKRQSGVALIGPHRNQFGGRIPCSLLDVAQAHDAFQAGTTHPALRITDEAMLAVQIDPFDVQAYPFPAPDESVSSLKFS